MPEGDGINHLGKELISQAEKPLLEARLGDETAFNSLEVIEGLRYRSIHADFREHGLLSYEIFGSHSSLFMIRPSSYLAKSGIIGMISAWELGQPAAGRNGRQQESELSP